MEQLTREQFRDKLRTHGTLAARSSIWSRHDEALGELFELNPEWYAEDYRELERDLTA